MTRTRFPGTSPEGCMKSSNQARRLVPGLALLLAASVGTTARADPFGGDLPLLSGLLVQATETVMTVNQQLATARRTYDEIRRFAGYAEEAADAFHEFSNLVGLLDGSVQDVLDHAFPELSAIRAEAERLGGGGRFADNSGELGRLVRVCLGTGQCTLVREALSFQQTRESLAHVFGEAPEGAADLGAADDEAAVALAQSGATVGRSAVTREYAAELMKLCRRERAAANSGAAAACQAAAAAAQIASLESDANLADSVAQTNRLQALQLLLQAQERKRELREAQERRDLLLEGARVMARPPGRVTTDGFDVTEGE